MSIFAWHLKGCLSICGFVGLEVLYNILIFLNCFSVQYSRSLSSGSTADFCDFVGETLPQVIIKPWSSSPAMWNFAMNIAGIGCCAAKGSDRAVHKIVNVLYAYKDSLNDLKEAEEIMKSEGTPADVDLIQVTKTLRERVTKLLLDVLEVHKLQECLGVAQSAPHAPAFSSTLCECPEVSCAGVDGEAKRRRVLLSKTGAKTKISVGGSKDGDVVHTDLKGKGRVMSEGELLRGFGKRVAEEEMNPSIWSNLPVNLVELVLALVVPQIEDSSQCRSTRLPDTLPPSKVNSYPSP